MSAAIEILPDSNKPGSDELAQEIYWDMMTQGAGLLLDGYYGSDNGNIDAQLDLLRDHYSQAANGGYSEHFLVAACGRARTMRLEGKP